MPFWLLKFSVSPLWALVSTIVAPVRWLASSELTWMPPSTVTALAPAVYWAALPPAVTVGAGIVTSTVSVTVSDVVGLAALSSACTVTSRGVVTDWSCCCWRRSRTAARFDNRRPWPCR